MNNDLIKRYIFAAASYLPAKAQAEVTQELENMIAELLDARCGDREATDEDIRAVLQGLGAPEELAMQYSGEANKALLSGIYFLWYKKLLKIVLLIVVASVGLGMTIAAFVQWSPEQDAVLFVSGRIATAFSAMVQGALHTFFWMLIIFVMLERQKVKFNSGDFLADLPPVPDKRAQIKLHEPIISICWHIVAAVLFLGFPYLIGGYTESTGWVPAFNQDYIRGTWYLIALWAVIGIAHEVHRLVERRHSKKLALSTLAANILMGITVVMFFANKNIMNPAFDALAAAVFKVEIGESAPIFPPLNLIFLAIILFALLVETGEAVFRALRYDR